MKKKYLVLWLIGISYIHTLFNMLAFDSDCDNCKSAHPAGFPFVFCNTNTNKYEWLCLTDPHNRPLQFQHLKPYKLCDLAYSYSSSKLRYGSISDPDGFNVFNSLNVNNIIRDQLNKWRNICTPIQDDNCYECIIRIIWAHDEDYANYPGKIDHAAYTNREPEASSGIPSSCKLNCLKFQIMLNHSKRRLNVDFNKMPRPVPENFFYTDYSPDPNDWPLNSYLDFKKVILHELGHALGFEHTSANCGESNSIMSDNPYNHTRNLSDYDKCMFRLLYCCESITDVEEDKPDPNNVFVIIPNPSSDYFYLDFLVDAINNNVSIVIYNQLGIQVKTVMNKIYPDGKFTEKFNISDLPSGVYSLIIMKGTEQETRKIVILK